MFVLGEQQIWQVCRSMFLNAAYGRVDMKQGAIVRGLNALLLREIVRDIKSRR